MPSVYSECACPNGPHQCVGCERILSGAGVVCVACLAFEAVQLGQGELWPGEDDEYAAAEQARRMVDA